MKNQISQHVLLSLTIWCQYIWNLLFSVHKQDLQNLSVSEEQQEGVSQVSVVHFFLSENMFIIYLQHVIILNTSLIIYVFITLPLWASEEVWAINGEEREKKRSC